MKRRAAKSRAHERHPKVDRCLIEAGIARRHGGDFPIANLGPSEADRKHGRTRRGVVDRPTCAVAAIREEHNARDRLPAGLLANGQESAAEITSTRVSAQPIGRSRRQTVADGV